MEELCIYMQYKSSQSILQNFNCFLEYFTNIPEKTVDLF